MFTLFSVVSFHSEKLRGYECVGPWGIVDSMAMMARLAVLVVGLGLVGASGVIDAAAGTEASGEESHTSMTDVASSLGHTRARQLVSKAAGRVDAAIVASTGFPGQRSDVEIRRLGSAERRHILGAEPDRTIDLPVHGSGVEDAYLELVSRGGHVDLRGGYARFSGDATLFRGPLRPAAYLVFKAEAHHRYLVECSAWASDAVATLSASDGEAVFGVQADERVSLLYRSKNDGGAAKWVTVVISADRPDWFLEGCELSSAEI